MPGRRVSGPAARTLLAVGALVSILLLAACADAKPKRAGAHTGPIVLITFEGLRDDAVSALGGGEPGLTPRFDALAEHAWIGRGIAGSGWAETSMAGLLTGLSSWQHQLLAPGMRELPAGVLTLAEALHGAGYRTYGFGSAREVKLGLARGFEEFGDFGKGHAAMDRLSRLSGGRELVWIHLAEPRPPFVRRDWLLARLRDVPPHLPRRLTGAQVEQLLDREAADPEVQRKLGAMYRSNVAWADERLGRLLDALEASGKRDRTLVVVASIQGEDFGPGRLGGRDGGLGRQILEVPLAVALPAGAARPIAVPAKRPVALARLWATIAETAGLALPPATAPSLFRPAPAAILSDLYCAPDGANHFSLLLGADQLLWRTRFAAPNETDGARAAAFAAALPLHGPNGPPLLDLLRWGPGGSRPLPDAVKRQALAAELERAWRRFVPEERSPADEARERRIAEPL